MTPLIPADRHKAWALRTTWELNPEEWDAYCNLTSAFGKCTTEVGVHALFESLI